MNTLLLLILALLPGLFLLYFILLMDRNEKEPLGLVLLMILLGALSCAPAIVMEILLGLLPIYNGGKILSAIATAFVRVAWVEELAKLSVVLLVAWKSRNFNEENDGIVYMGASALGFAMLENVFYVLSSGVTTGIVRAVTAMPLHYFTGVLMGYYVGLAKFAPSKKEARNLILKGFFLAYLIHGTYDALLMTRTPALLLNIPLLIGLVTFGIRFHKKGRTLSLVRAAAQSVLENDAVTRQTVMIQSYPKNQVWKIITSRTLFVICGLFWALIIAMIAFPGGLEMSIGELILGAIILTFLPIITGAILEISYHRKKKVFLKIRESMPGKEITNGDLRTSPPGQIWKIFISRPLLAISGLFWTFTILGLTARIEEYGPKWYHLLLGSLIVTSLPISIGILLENSYRQKKKEYKRMRLEAAKANDTQKSIPTTSKALSDEELHDYCRDLKAKRKEKELTPKK
jgi:RsiW-degrading membrane proteinase PrsW (M82 family)